jgi:hypothetical protein
VSFIMQPAPQGSRVEAQFACDRRQRGAVVVQVVPNRAAHLGRKVRSGRPRGVLDDLEQALPLEWIGSGRRRPHGGGLQDHSGARLVEPRRHAQQPAVDRSVFLRAVGEMSLDRTDASTRQLAHHAAAHADDQVIEDARSRRGDSIGPVTQLIFFAQSVQIHNRAARIPWLPGREVDQGLLERRRRLHQRANEAMVTG